MSISVPPTASGRVDAAVSSDEIPQLRIPGIFAIWAWPPRYTDGSTCLAGCTGSRGPVRRCGVVPMLKALIVCLTRGLVGSSFSSLWLRSLRSPRSGRVGGRVWLMVILFAIAFAAFNEMIPTFGAPENRVFATLLESDVGKAFLDGAWGWHGLILALFVFTTVLAEELLFRGYLLPRMNSRLRTRRLGRDWTPPQRLPPPRPVGDAADAVRHIHPRLPNEALPKRLDRDRGTQCPKRVLCDRIAPDRPLTQHRCSLTSPSPVGRRAHRT